MTQSEFDAVLEHFEAAIDDVLVIHPVYRMMWRGFKKNILDPAETELELKLVKMGILQPDVTNAAQNSSTVQKVVQTTQMVGTATSASPTGKTDAT